MNSLSGHTIISLGFISKGSASCLFRTCLHNSSFLSTCVEICLSSNIQTSPSFHWRISQGKGFLSISLANPPEEVLFLIVYQLFLFTERSQVVVCLFGMQHPSIHSLTNSRGAVRLPHPVSQYWTQKETSCLTLPRSCSLRRLGCAHPVRAPRLPRQRPAFWGDFSKKNEAIDMYTNLFLFLGEGGMNRAYLGP